MNNYNNLDVKFYAQKHHVLEKDVAKELGIGYSTLLTLWLRKPLDKARRARFEKAVDNIINNNHKPISDKDKIRKCLLDMSTFRTKEDGYYVNNMSAFIELRKLLKRDYGI